MTDWREILLREYQEAGETSRAHAVLLRTGLTLLTAVQAAIIGFIASRKGRVNFPVVLLSTFGVWMSLVAWITTHRLTKRYAGYMRRAREIEERLGMNLYRGSNELVSTDTWFRGERLWPSVPAMSFIVFVALSVYLVNKWL